MTFGWYGNSKVANLINLNALSEIIYFIKEDRNLSNSNIKYIHDEIKQFKEVFNDELKKHKINIFFQDSRKEELLQLIDNVVSIFRHSYDKMIYHLNNKEELKKQSTWDMKLMSKIQTKLTVKHINYTVPICDWAAALCIQKMYSSKFPKDQRNRFVFNWYYVQNMELIYLSLLDSMNTLKKVYSILEK